MFISKSKTRKVLLFLFIPYFCANFSMFKISSAIVLLIVASCQSSVTETKTEMEFAIDSLLVDRQVNDSALNISYHIPSGWIPIEAPVNKQPGITISNFFY